MKYERNSEARNAIGMSKVYVKLERQNDGSGVLKMSIFVHLPS